MKALVVVKEFTGFGIGYIINHGANQIIDNMKGNHISTHCIKLSIPSELEDKPIKAVILDPRNQYWSKEGEDDVEDMPIIDDHWIKGEDVLYDAPVIEEYWSKDGEDDRSELPMTDEYWSKDGEDDVYVDPIDETWDYHAPEEDTSWLHVPTQLDDSYTHVPSIFDSSWTHHPAILENTWAIVLDKSIDDGNKVKNKYSSMMNEIYDDLENIFQTRKDSTSTRRYLSAMAMKDDPAFFAGKGMTAEFSVGSFAEGDDLDTETKISNYANSILDEAKQFVVDANLKIKQFRIDKNDILS